MKNILNNCFFKRKKKFKRNWPNNNFIRTRGKGKFLGYSIGRKIATFAPLGRRRYDPQFRRCWIVQKESAWMEHRGVERGFQPPKFTPPATIGTMRAVPFSALPFFIKPWKYYRPTLAIHPGYSCQRLTTAASLVFLLHAAPTYRIICFLRKPYFFFPCHHYKNNFFREVFEVFAVHFHHEWDIFVGSTKNCVSFSILFRFNISFFLFFFFSSPIFSEIWEFRRNEYVTFAWIFLYNTRDERPGRMNNVFFSLHPDIVFRFRIFLSWISKFDSLSFLLLITSGEKNQFQDLINFLLSNESIMRRVIL